MVNSIEHDRQQIEMLAQAVTKQLIAGWLLKTGPYERRGFRIIIHVEPGQTQARIEWPPPLEHVVTTK